MAHTPSSRNPYQLLVSVVRAVSHLSIREADLEGGYHGAVEFDPEHSVIYLDRSHSDDDLAAELARAIPDVLAADRENTRAMLRALAENEARPPDRSCEARYRGGGGGGQRPGVVSGSLLPAPHSPHDLAGE